MNIRCMIGLHKWSRPRAYWKNLDVGVCCVRCKLKPCGERPELPRNAPKAPPPPPIRNSRK